MSILEDVMAFQMSAVKLPAPDRELRFHDTRKWRFDFAWTDRMIALEIDGGSWVRGRHVRPEGFEDDCEKLNAAALLGWTVLRVTGDMVRDGRALKIVESMLHSRNGKCL